MFARTKTHDARNFTEGEVMSAIGMLIGNHCESDERVQAWLRAVSASTTITYAAKKGHK